MKKVNTEEVRSLRATDLTKGRLLDKSLKFEKELTANVPWEERIGDIDTISKEGLYWLLTVTSGRDGIYNCKDDKLKTTVLKLTNRTKQRAERFPGTYTRPRFEVTGTQVGDERVNVDGPRLLHGKTGYAPEKELNISHCIKSLKPFDDSPIEIKKPDLGEVLQSAWNIHVYNNRPLGFTGSHGHVSDLDLIHKAYALRAVKNEQNSKPAPADTPRLQLITSNGISLHGRKVVGGIALATEGGHNHAGSARDAKFLIRRTERTKAIIAKLNCSNAIKQQLWSHHLQTWKEPVVKELGCSANVEHLFSSSNGKLIDDGKPEGDCTNLNFTRPTLEVK